MTSHDDVDMPVALTDVDHWDSVWSNTHLPAEILKGRRAYVDAITDVFDRLLPREVSALELGGAVGAWAVYLARRLGMRVSVLDYAPAGVELTRRNFDLLGVPGEVTLGDMFTAEGGSFDLVYSLGVIEHFDDTRSAVAAHLRFVRPGGIVMVGCPNYGGINRAIARYVSPTKLAEHNLEAMRVNDWPEMFENQLGLEPIFRGYVGGFEPLMHKVAEGRRLDRRVVAASMLVIGGALNLRVMRPLRTVNGGALSNYCLGIYHAP